MARSFCLGAIVQVILWEFPIEHPSSKKLSTQKVWGSKKSVLHTKGILPIISNHISNIWKAFT